MSIENQMPKFALRRSAMCVLKPHTAPTERSAALDGCYKHIAPTEQRYLFWFLWLDGRKRNTTSKFEFFY